ncbi:MAG: hypothetical protein ABI333_26195 [bacterium]
MPAFLELLGTVGWVVTAWSEDSFLSKNDWIMVVVGVVVIAIIVTLGVIKHVRSANEPKLDEACDKCGSVNVQHRAGLAVCVDCGNSVHTSPVKGS